MNDKDFIALLKHVDNLDKLFQELIHSFQKFDSETSAKFVWLDNRLRSLEK